MVKHGRGIVWHGRVRYGQAWHCRVMVWHGRGMVRHGMVGVWYGMVG